MSGVFRQVPGREEGERAACTEHRGGGRGYRSARACVQSLTQGEHAPLPYLLFA